MTEVEVSYPVMERFYTIQGEGMHTGRPAWFIRLGGCDVGCVWCDVKESWDPNAHPKYTSGELANEAIQAAARFVVVTGGEPAMHDLRALSDSLKQADFERAIETSGAYPLSGEWDWICVSPKKFKPALDSVLQIADELKVVVFHESDLTWAKDFMHRVSPDTHLILQPEYSKFEQVMPAIIEFVKANPRWRIGLQTHKIIQVP